MTGGESFFHDPAHPHRPQSPDYWRLTEIVLELDGQTAEAGMRLDEIIGQVVDPNALGYLAMQRAMRLVGVNTRGDLVRHRQEVTKLATVYHEAFVVGARFAERGGHVEGAR